MGGLCIGRKPPKGQERVEPAVASPTVKCTEHHDTHPRKTPRPGNTSSVIADGGKTRIQKPVHTIMRPTHDQKAQVNGPWRRKHISLHGHRRLNTDVVSYMNTTVSPA